MNNDLKFTLRFDAENKQFIGQVKQAGTAVNQLGGDAGKTQGKLSGLSRESDKLTGELGSLKNQVLGLAGGFSALFAAQQAKDSLAQYQDIRTQITALVGGQQEWIETEQYLNQVADEHNKTLDTLSGTYARLLALENGGLISHEQTIALFEGMSNAASANGATSEHLASVMYGLQQAMASGTVRAEEFNQVTDPMPDLLIKIAQAANTTVGGLREMVNTSKMSSKLFGELLVKALANYDGAAARTADNVSAKSAEMARAYQQAVVAFEQPISDSFTVFAESSAGALTLLAENADLVTTIVGVSMSAAMGRGAAAVYVLTTAKLQAIAATHKQEQANYAELKSLAAKQQIEVRYLETLRQSNNQKFRAIGAESQLTAARQRLVTTTGALAAAQSRLNIASRAGSALLGILGGPAGIAMMAAGAIGYFALSSSDAAEETDNFSDRIDTLLGKMDKLQARELSKALEEANSKLSLTQARIETLSKQRGTKDIDERLKQLETLRNEEQSYSQAVIELEDKLYEIRNRPLDKPDSDTPQDDKLLESANKMLANLQKQNALYGQTTHAAKVKYELEHGSLKGINEELAKKLMLEAQSLDAKEATKKDKKDTAVIDAFYEESDQLQTAWLQRLSIVADMENKASVEEKFAYERRKEALSQSFQEAYERAVGDQELMDALEREYFGNREILRAQHEMNLTDIAKKAEEKRQAYQYQTAMNTLNFTQQQLAITTDFLKQSGEEQSAMYRALFMVQKLAAIPSMIIATEEAATKALTLGPIAGPIASAAVKTLGYASVGIVAGQAFAGQAHDGINRVPRENEGTWLLKANEMVLNPTQADNFRWMVDMMQQMKAMMGAAMTVSASAPAANDSAVSVNVSGVDRSDNSSTNNVGSDLYLTLNLVEDASRAGTVEQSSDGDMTTLDIKVAKLMQSSSTQTAQVMQTRFRIQQYGS